VINEKNNIALKRIALRHAWPNEATGFTPWLADNLSLLGNVIGIELELEATERNIGSCRADILAKDIITGNRVLVENQLEDTDHKHMGQLIAYASGLKAATAVWIAGRVTDEYRDAINWLNEITGKDINFFALEIELWQSGDQVMPKFNVICKPHLWNGRVFCSKNGNSHNMVSIIATATGITNKRKNSIVPEEIAVFFHRDLNISQISLEAASIVEKVYYDEELLEKELDTLLNISETAAVLSVKYRKPVNSLYVRELTRDFVNAKTGHVTPARLQVVRKISAAQLYKTRDVLAVRMQGSKGRGKRDDFSVSGERGYSQEVKNEAIRLYQEGTLSKRAIGRKLNVSYQAINNWTNFTETP
jgi:hypothetical protein